VEEEEEEEEEMTFNASSELEGVDGVRASSTLRALPPVQGTFII
jgi:hypothetical protein